MSQCNHEHFCLSLNIGRRGVDKFYSRCYTNCCTSDSCSNSTNTRCGLNDSKLSIICVSRSIIRNVIINNQHFRKCILIICDVCELNYKVCNIILIVIRTNNILNGCSRGCNAGISSLKSCMIQVKGSNSSCITITNTDDHCVNHTSGSNTYTRCRNIINVQ